MLKLDSPTTLSNFLPNMSDDTSAINIRKRTLESISTLEDVQEEVEGNDIMSGRALDVISGIPL